MHASIRLTTCVTLLAVIIHYNTLNCIADTNMPKSATINWVHTDLSCAQGRWGRNVGQITQQCSQNFRDGRYL